MKHRVTARTFMALLLVASVPALPGQVPGGERADRLESHVRYLADDALEGRFMGTPGIEEAAHYIAGEFQVLGLEPLPDSSYLQEFDLAVREQDIGALTFFQ